MKQPMEWHMDCHKNHTASLRQRRAELARMTAELQRSERELSQYETQIATATARGMAGFDRDRFLVKRSG